VADDLRPPFSVFQGPFGIAATVVREGEDPIDTTAIWVPPLPEEVPFGTGAQEQQPLRVLALPLSDVPTVPRGTLIECAEAAGQTVQTWRVDGPARFEFDCVRVIVVPFTEST
jgi:hypothetical protein